MNPTIIILVSIIIGLVALLCQHLWMRSIHAARINVTRDEGKREGDTAGHARATTELTAHYVREFEKFQNAAIAVIRTQAFLPKGRHLVHMLHNHKGKNYALVQIVSAAMIPGTVDQPYPEFAVILLDTKRTLPSPLKAIVIEDDPVHFE